MATTANLYLVTEDLNKNNDSLKKDHDHHDDDYNNTRARAYARGMDRIKESYGEVFGRSMPRFVLQEVQEMTMQGARTDMIAAVIEYTACAPRPSWAYARAVIYRSMGKHIYTEYDFLAALSARGRDGADDNFV